VNLDDADHQNREGALPPGWLSVRVDEAGAVRLGRQRSPDQQVGDYPTKYIRAANITRSGLDLEDLLEMNFTPTERETFRLQLGDVLLTEASGSPSQVGRAAIWRGGVEPCCYQNTVIRFRPHLVSSEFALIAFRYMSASGVFGRTARGVGIQHLGASRFAALDIPLPPQAEQARIANAANDRLSQIQDARARLESALAHLEEQVREILAAAVAGELTHQEQEDGELPPGGTVIPWDLFEDDDRPIPEGFDSKLPDGWCWTRVDRAGEVTLGRQRAPRFERGAHMRPYLRVANVHEDRIDTSDILTMNFEPAEAQVYALRAGDILLNEGQSPELVGRPALYRDEVPGAFFQNTLIRFRSHSGVDPDFALLVFRHYLHSGVFRRIARWSTNIAHLGLDRFRSLPFPVPPLAEQERIANEAGRRLTANRAQLGAVRSSLARIPDIERELLAAAMHGELVPQDPADEPATTLIKRLGSPPAHSRTLPQARSTKGPRMVNRRPSEEAAPTADLVEVITHNGGRLALPELFALAGFDRDRPEHVELFYLALREVLGTKLASTSVEPYTENALVELIDAA